MVIETNSGPSPVTTLAPERDTSHDPQPPNVSYGNEYRLASHVIPELSALVNIAAQRKKGRPFLTGNYATDMRLGCSPESKRIIQSRLFSPHVRIYVWGRDPSGSIVPVSNPNRYGRYNARKELRNVAVGIVLGNVLEYQRAKSTGAKFSIGYVPEEGSLPSHTATEKVLLSPKSKPAEKLSGRGDNAKAEIDRAIREEYIGLQVDIFKVMHAMKQLPENHPLFWMMKNLSLLVRADSPLTPSYQYIRHGINTFRETMSRTNQLIEDLVAFQQQSVDPKFQYHLTPEGHINTFGASVDIAGILSNMNIDLFINRVEPRLLTPTLKARFNPVYFSYKPFDEANPQAGGKITFSDEGFRVIRESNAGYLEGVNISSEDRVVQLTTTTRCPARREGVYKADDIILNLYARITKKARQRLKPALRQK